MKKNAWFQGRLAAVCVFCAVYWLTGGNAVYIAHDQYDGDMMNYILHARHLTSTTVPEYMGGLDKTFLALGAPLFLPLYALLPPLWAFCAHTTLVALRGCAFVLSGVPIDSAARGAAMGANLHARGQYLYRVSVPYCAIKAV